MRAIILPSIARFHNQVLISRIALRVVILCVVVPLSAAWTSAATKGKVRVSVAVAPSTASTITGQSQAFSAAVTGTNNQTVSWSASGGSITSSGKFSSSVAGAYTVTATSAADHAQSASATVTVAPATYLLSESATAVNFGNLSIGTRASATTTLTNTGNSGVTVSAANVVGAEFSVSGAVFPLTLVSGASQNIVVSFDPTVAGTVSGSASFISNATNSPTVISLSGTGTTTTSTTALASSLDPSAFGQSVTFTATVSGAGATPTGTVTFKDGSATLGSAVLSSGKAGFATNILALGSHSITAVYGGDNNYLASTSATLAQRVNQETSTTAVSSSLNPALLGQSVTFTAVVSGSGATPTGTVTFKDGATALGSCTVSEGKAILTSTTLPSGLNSITAVYGGDANFSGSTSAVLSETVNTQHWVGLSWTAGTSAVVGYYVYRGTQSGGPYTMLNTSYDNDPNYSDSTVTAGSTYYYVVTAVDSSGREGNYSNEVTATIPTP